MFIIKNYNHYLFKNTAFYLLLIIVINSCTMSGGSKDSGVSRFITGATKVDAVKDVHIVNMIRAIGMPNNSIPIGKYKYYQWQYSQSAGVSTILGGASTTFYCSLSAETQNNKVKLMNWYGNRCNIFLDQINEYFQNKLNIVVITDDDIKQQTVTNIKSDSLTPLSDTKQIIKEQKPANLDSSEKPAEQKNEVPATAHPDLNNKIIDQKVGVVDLQIKKME